MSKIIPEKEFKFKTRFEKPKPIVLTREEFINRLRDSIMNPEKEVKGQYLDKYATKVGNEYMTKTTFNDLLNKVDLILANQEVIIKLLANNRDKETIPATPTERDIFKKNVATGEMLKVGLIDIDNRIVLDEPPEVTIKSPNLYRNSWCVKHPIIVGSCIFVEPEGLMTIMGEKAIQNEIVITRRGKTFTTGVITVDGKAIYYDQYL